MLNFAAYSVKASLLKAVSKKGSRRIAASDKHDLGLKLIEGKKALSFQAYKRLAEILFWRKKIEHISTHTFLVLECSLFPFRELALKISSKLILPIF